MVRNNIISKYGEDSKPKKEMIEKAVKESLDIIILSKLMEESMCGYDILAYFHEKFDIFLSPGQLYPILYTLERHSLIQHTNSGRRKIYTIISKPKIQSIMSDYLNVHKSVMDLITKDGAQPSKNMEELTEEYNGLKASDELKTRFIQDTVHELRTPLSVILASLEILRTDSEDRGERERLLESLVRNSERLRDAIEEVLVVYKTEREERRAKEKVEIGDVIGEAIKKHRFAADRKGLDIITEINNLPKITGDRKALITMMGNLIENAVKFTEKGKIVVTAGRKNGDIAIDVQDTGIGIAKENSEDIFERFYKISPESPGGGIGLSICRNVVEAHGGRIGCSSEYGAGSKFSLTLPISKVLDKKPDLIIDWK